VLARRAWYGHESVAAAPLFWTTLYIKTVSEFKWLSAILRSRQLPFKKRRKSTTTNKIFLKIFGRISTLTKLGIVMALAEFIVPFMRLQNVSHPTCFADEGAD